MFCFMVWIIWVPADNKFRLSWPTAVCNTYSLNEQLNLST